MSKNNLLRRLVHDEDGATAIEYGLILAMVTLTIMVALKGFAGEALETWNDVSTKSATAMSGS